MFSNSKKHLFANQNIGEKRCIKINLLVNNNNKITTNY